MSMSDRELIDKIARSGGDHSAPYGWQNQVFWQARARPDTEPARNTDRAVPGS